MSAIDPLYKNIHTLEQLGVSYHNACMIESLRVNRKIKFKTIQYLIEKRERTAEWVIDMLIQTVPPPTRRAQTQ